MGFEGFARFGGVEIVNNERARAYSWGADCPVAWLKGPRCETLADALGDGSYDFADMPDAPWYDASQPDVSGRFYGVFGLSFDGLKSSTRQLSVVEGVDDGASVGRTRKASRSVRVRAILIARGRDALDYGAAWLNAALNTGACGQHGTGCGTTDFEYLTDCPPARGEVAIYGDWAPGRENLCENPSIELDVAGWTGTDASVARSTDFARSGDASLRVEPSAANGGAQYTEATSGGQTYTWSAWVYSETAKTVRAGAGTDFGPSVLIPAGTWTRVFSDPILASGTPTSFAVLSDNDPALTPFYVDDALLELGADTGGFFDGDTPTGDTARYSWVGAPHASVSLEEVRSVTFRPQDDDEYATDVAPLRRYLHEVAVSSGPIERDLYNRGDFWGQVFEWTMVAGRPWVYSVTRPVTLPVTPTIVVQDVPYNLMRYPSAELASPDEVIIATNFSANPSVESNATGWAGSQSVIPVGQISSGRVTGELSAVGTASYRRVFTASGSGSGGSFAAEQVISLAGRPAGSGVSVSMWAASLVMSGLPDLDSITFEADWRDASNVVLRTDALGSTVITGGSVSIQSIDPPAGATSVLVRASLQVDSWSPGDIVRLYADALSVTVP